MQVAAQSPLEGDHPASSVPGGATFCFEFTFESAHKGMIGGFKCRESRHDVER